MKHLLLAVVFLTPLMAQAEYTTMAFRSAPQSVVVGSTTAGADGNVSEIPLPGGQRTMISGHRRVLSGQEAHAARWHYP